MPQTVIENPIISSPFAVPQHHFRHDDHGITPDIVEGRRQSFYVRYAYFAGANQPCDQLKRALRAEIDKAAWSALYSTVSQPFPVPFTGKGTVQVITHYGDKAMRVYKGVLGLGCCNNRDHTRCPQLSGVQNTADNVRQKQKALKPRGFRALLYLTPTPRISTRLTSGRVNSSGSRSPRARISRTCVPLRVTC